MIYFKSVYSKYNWNIEVFVIINKPNIDFILDRLKKLNSSEEILNKAIYKITNYENSGFTFTNPELYSSILVINLPSSIEEFIDTYEHEKNHVEMNICKRFNIDPFSEKASYLSGELGNIIFMDLLKTFIKN